MCVVWLPADQPLTAAVFAGRVARHKRRFRDAGRAAIESTAKFLGSFRQTQPLSAPQNLFF
jgi:hypothetical protein